ncbi:histidine kinase [Flavobacterium sp.]|uniref:histidine kinase n=1 Tax=Flavobacterium sp. TaxID=239 RepID=UPI00352843E3
MALYYNLAKIYEISENDYEFALQVVSSFLEEVPIEIDLIKTGISEKDYNKVYASAHKIKPSLDLLGMDLAFEENLEIMKWAKKNGKKKEISETYKSLKKHVNSAIKELKKDFKIDQE